MTTLNVVLPDAMREFVEAQAQREGFGSTSDYLRALIEDAQRRQTKRELEAKLLEGLRSGPSTPLTVEDWDEIERAGQERLASEQRRS